MYFYECYLLEFKINKKHQNKIKWCYYSLEWPTFKICWHSSNRLIFVTWFLCSGAMQSKPYTSNTWVSSSCFDFPLSLFLLVLYYYSVIVFYWVIESLSISEFFNFELFFTLWILINFKEYFTSRNLSKRILTSSSSIYFSGVLAISMILSLISII